MEDRYQFLVVGPDVSALPEIVALMTDLNLPTKVAVIDSNITDLKYRFSVLDAETNNNTIEIGGASGGFRVRDTNYDRAIAALSSRPFFLGYFNSEDTNYLFNGTFYLENASVPSFPIGNSSRSMFGWVRPSSENVSRKVLFGYGPVDTNRTNDHNMLVYNKDLQREVKFWGESINLVTDANNALTVGSWNFVGMVYDGNILTLYVNDKSWTITVNLDTEAGAFRVGLGMADYAAITDLFVGDISNISVFNVAKDRSYVNALRAYGRIGYDQLPFSLLYDPTLSNLEIGNSDSKESVFTTVHVQSDVVTSKLAFASGGVVTWEVASLEVSTDTFFVFSNSVLDTLKYQSQGGKGTIDVNTPVSVTQDLYSNTIEQVSTESDLLFRDGLGDENKGTAVSISYTTSDFTVSGGQKLQSQKSVYKGPISYWDLSETKGTRYDSVAKYHLTPKDIKVDFTANVTSSFNIAFKDTTYPLASSWSWNFGDGNFSVLQNPNHVYAAVGEYNVQLTVNNSLSVTHQATAIEFLIDEPMDGSLLIGDLFGSAVYNPPSPEYVHLTSKVTNTYGAIDYNNASSPLLPTDKRLTVEYEFYADGRGDAVYFYMFNTSIPEVEDYVGSSGYEVSCSEFHNEVAVWFNGILINSVSYGGLGNATWRSMKIVYFNQIFTVYINGVQVLVADDSLSVRNIASNPFYGVAARCGAEVAQHRIRNLKIYV